MVFGDGGGILKYDSSVVFDEIDDGCEIWVNLIQPVLKSKQNNIFLFYNSVINGINKYKNEIDKFGLNIDATSDKIV